MNFIDKQILSLHEILIWPFVRLRRQAEKRFQKSVVITSYTLLLLAFIVDCIIPLISNTFWQIDSSDSFLFSTFTVQPYRYWFSAQIFSRAIALTYLIAFWSLKVQIEGLIGEKGILPAIHNYRKIEQSAADEIQSEEEETDNSTTWFLTVCSFIQRYASRINVAAAKLSAGRTETNTMNNNTNNNNNNNSKIEEEKEEEEEEDNINNRYETTHNLICWIGIASSIVMFIVGFDTNIISLLAAVCCYVTYLSLYNVCGEFLSLQWDILLQETGILTICLALSNTSLVHLLDAVFHFFTGNGFTFRSLSDQNTLNFGSNLSLLLVRWLIFRLMFSSGVVKLSSNCPEWRAATAMNVHYLTQPLPSRSSWYFHNMSDTSHHFNVVMTWICELWTSFFYLIPIAPLRIIGFCTNFMIQTMITSTGNYGFFNYLSIFLGIPLICDDVWARVLYPLLPSSLFTSWFPYFEASSPSTTGVGHALGSVRSIFYATEVTAIALVVLAFFIIIMVASYTSFALAFRGSMFPSRQYLRLFFALQTLHAINTYGLFARMTTFRNELIFEGSHDKIHWHPIEFKYKPSDVNRSPPFVPPGHMPRLDWQLWFVPLGRGLPKWLILFVLGLLTGDEPIYNLLHWRHHQSTSQSNENNALNIDHEKEGNQHKEDETETPLDHDGNQEQVDYNESNSDEESSTINFTPENPPTYIRITLHEYFFTSQDEYKNQRLESEEFRNDTDTSIHGVQYWKRRYIRQFLPAVDLRRCLHIMQILSSRS